MSGPTRGALHHLELWVPDLARAAVSWGWLLQRLDHVPHQLWEHGRSWRTTEGAGPASYVVLEQSAALMAARHERTRPGLNHVAFWAGTRSELDELVLAAPAYGWRLLFPELHPYAGGPEHYAAYLEDTDGYEVELVATGA